MQSATASFAGEPEGHRLAKRAGEMHRVYDAEGHTFREANIFGRLFNNDW
jgi:hypothetical protein